MENILKLAKLTGLKIDQVMVLYITQSGDVTGINWYELIWSAIRIMILQN